MEEINPKETVTGEDKDAEGNVRRRWELKDGTPFWGSHKEYLEAKAGQKDQYKSSTE